MKRGPSIRYLLLTANAFIVLLPVGAIVFLQLWDTHLVRITEEQLISQSVLIGESWMQHLDPERALPARIDAVLAEGYEILPPAAPRRPEAAKGPAQADVGAATERLLRQVQRLNLTAARLLDAKGCVVSSTEGDQGACFDTPEVVAALSGTYAAAARRPLDRASQPADRPHGNVRVFTATPLHSDAGVAGVVYLASTSSSPLEALWTLRYTLLLGLAGCILLMGTVTLFLSRAISQPVRAITDAAEAVARGESPEGFELDGIVPAEVQALSRSLEHMTAQLTERSRYIAEFAANVSHELKTPLTSIRGVVELLREQWQEMSEEERHRFLDNVDADVSRTQRLVTRLLQLARIQSSSDGIERLAVGEFFRRLGERYGEELILHLPQPDTTIEINPDHLETAVHNLVDNALRHGAGQPVDLSVEERDGRLVIRVRDRGRGISEGNRARLFERFFTTERDRGGTGLGLALVRAVAETRGGSVTFQTGSDGTVFTLVV
jgi:signal transduction histidine kinase